MPFPSANDNRDFRSDPRRGPPAVMLWDEAAAARVRSRFACHQNRIKPGVSSAQKLPLVPKTSAPRVVAGRAPEGEKPRAPAPRNAARKPAEPARPPAGRGNVVLVDFGARKPPGTTALLAYLEGQFLKIMIIAPDRELGEQLFACVRALRDGRHDDIAIRPGAGHASGNINLRLRFEEAYMTVTMTVPGREMVMQLLECLHPLRHLGFRFRFHQDQHAFSTISDLD